MKTKHFNATHGMSGTPTFNVWVQMRMRCTNPKNASYPRYVGRGITVCNRWLKFENFFADMGMKPAGKTLDRVNNERGYCPSNCRWATSREQTRNTRCTKMFSWRGKRQILEDWAQDLKAPRETLKSRLTRGWSLHRTLTTPATTKTQGRGRRYLYRGTPLTLTELTAVSPAPMKTLAYRLQSGWDVMKAVEAPVRRWH